MSKHKRKRSSRSRDRSDNGKRYKSDEEGSNESVQKRLKVIENALFFLMDEAKAKKLAEIADNQKSSDSNKKDNDKQIEDPKTADKSDKVSEIPKEKTNNESAASADPPSEDTESHLNDVTSKEHEIVTLDPEILDRMGADPTSRTIQDHAFHPELASRWNSWLAEGLSKEEKENMLKQYSRNGSCNLEAPVINEELVKAIPEATLKRDEYFRLSQNDIGTALSALGSAISLLLDEESEIDKFDLLGKLFDAGGLLTDTFHRHTKARKAYINPTLQSVKHVLDKTKTDKYLYGSKLVDAINNDKALDKLTQLVQKEKNQSRQNQENRKGPLVPQRQVGNYQNQGNKKFLKFQPRTSSQWKQARAPLANTQRQAPYQTGANNRFNKPRK
ncbi:hypothetical protein TKK_0008050 [Trichogramma kaykai]